MHAFDLLCYCDDLFFQQRQRCPVKKNVIMNGRARTSLVSERERHKLYYGVPRLLYVRNRDGRKQNLISTLNTQYIFEKC